MLFTAYPLKNITLKNRIVMAPMCMYSSDESGCVKDWHKIHYPTRAVGGTGLLILESTGVASEGRISTSCLGIWNDEQIPGLKELTDLIHAQGAHAGIQLNHAGRKSTVPGPILGPSPIAYDENFPVPEAMTQEQINEAVSAFADAARRAKAAGFDVIELHAAHGYLIHQFLSPLANHREDAYGGSRDNRYRFLSEVMEAVKREWAGPIIVRVSATDYHPDGLKPDDFVDYCRRLKEQGADLIDVSTGGVLPILPPQVYPGYQVPFAERIRRESGIATGAVGLITHAEHAEEILQNGRADLILLGRELLRDPYWPRAAAKRLGVEIEAPKPYRRGWL